jgi:hypothetical protein
MAMADGNGFPLAIYTSSASPHEVTASPKQLSLKFLPLKGLSD